MANSLTFDEAIESIKASGEKEKQAIECADKIAQIINKIASARIEKGMTQRQLAEKSGIKQSAIARMETLQVIPRVDTLVRIANSLDIEIDLKTPEEKATYTAFTIVLSDKYIYRTDPVDSNSNYRPVPVFIGGIA